MHNKGGAASAGDIIANDQTEAPLFCWVQGGLMDSDLERVATAVCNEPICLCRVASAPPPLYPEPRDLLRSMLTPERLGTQPYLQKENDPQRPALPAETRPPRAPGATCRNKTTPSAQAKLTPAARVNLQPNCLHAAEWCRTLGDPHLCALVAYATLSARRTVSEACDTEPWKITCTKTPASPAAGPPLSTFDTFDLIVPSFQRGGGRCIEYFVSLGVSHATHADSAHAQRCVAVCRVRRVSRGEGSGADLLSVPQTQRSPHRPACAV